MTALCPIVACARCDEDLMPVSAEALREFPELDGRSGEVIVLGIDLEDAKGRGQASGPVKRADGGDDPIDLLIRMLRRHRQAQDLVDDPLRPR